jgi:simple sugar transport system permease protein
VNLGQPGQVLMGALASTVVGLHVHVTGVVLVPFMLVSGALAGAAWSGIAALTKRRFGMNEFIVTLMLNEIARLFTDWVISSPLQDPAAGSVTTRAVDRRGALPMLTSTMSSLVLAVVAVVAVVVFRRSVAGYEWRMVGSAPRFAQQGGVDADRAIGAVMLCTGALAGLAGSVLLMAGPHKFLKGLGGNYGWDGVMIAVVAANALVGVVLYGLLFSALQTGAIGMQIRTDIPPEFVQILQATIVLVTVAGRGLAGTVWSGWEARRAARRVARAPG